MIKHAHIHLPAWMGGDWCSEYNGKAAEELAHGRLRSGIIIYEYPSPSDSNETRSVLFYLRNTGASGMEYIYVIGSHEPPYKVGKSKNPMKRLATLQTSSPMALRIHMMAECTDALTHETTLHSALAAFRLSGEWFGCSLERIRVAIDAAGLEPAEPQSLRNPAIPPAPLLRSFSPIEPSAFSEWSKRMRALTGRNDADLAQALGMTADDFAQAKTNGGDLRTALACRALLHRLEPYGV